jgi:flagellar biosynthesis protein FlhG
MTRIITIASGLDGVGKTHLALNMALELVRKGHPVGLYHGEGGRLAVSQLLRLPRHPGQKGRLDTGDVIVRGYQGVDLLSSRLPLSDWHRHSDAELSPVVAALEARASYEDLLIDTSGFSARAIVACCLQSPLVMLVVTPEQRSQTEAFGLLKVLQLNGFDNRVALVINKVSETTPVQEIHARFAEQARAWLGYQVHLLGSVAIDKHVVSAQGLRQAFTSLFPDTDAAAQVVKLVEALDRDAGAGCERDSTGLPDFWKALASSLHRPVHIAGHTDLEDQDADAVVARPEQQTGSRSGRSSSTMLRFEGPLEKFDNVMESFSAVMHYLADDMQSFHERLTALYESIDEAGTLTVVDANALEMILAIILKALRQLVPCQEQICIQVEESPVNGQDGDWLKRGRYVKYAFLVPGDDETIDLISRELERLPDLRQSKSEEGECICEAVSAARDACLSVINTSQGQIRVHFWHQPEIDKGLQGVAPATGLTKDEPADHHPTQKLLH